MCNYVHAESRMLKPNNEGYAYKMFTKFPTKDELSSTVFGVDYVADRSGWVKWDTKYPGHGFCVFLTEDDALRVAENWINLFKLPLYLIVKRVKYREMICTHKERIMVWKKSNTDIGLVKEFKPLETIWVNDKEANHGERWKA